MHPVESDFHLPGSGHCALSVHLHGGLGDTPRTSGSGWGHPLKVPKEDAPALLWSPFFLMAALGANGSSRSCVRSFNPQYWAGNRTHTSIETQAAAVRLPTHCATVGTVGTCSSDLCAWVGAPSAPGSTQRDPWMAVPRHFCICVDVSYINSY